MNAKIYSNEKFIGTVELLLGDETMGGLYGEFLPTADYYSYVQKAVWKFWSAQRPDYIKWSSLNFNARLDNGYFLYAVGGFTIDDSSEFPNEPKRIDIVGVDRHVIEDFFLQPEPRPFVEEPWESITIEQKIAFESELKTEMGNYQLGFSFLGLFNFKPDNHVLADFEISALRHDSRSDDVLFVTRKRDCEKEFAVVHLTWRGEREIDGRMPFGRREGLSQPIKQVMGK